MYSIGLISTGRTNQNNLILNQIMTCGKILSVLWFWFRGILQHMLIVRKMNLPSAPSKGEIYHDNILIWRSINIIVN